MKPHCVCDWDLTVIDVDARRLDQFKTTELVLVLQADPGTVYCGL